MVRQAVASEDPVVLLEPKRRYWDKAEVDVAMDLTEPPLHSSALLQGGSDVTLVGYGPTVRVCLDAAAAAGEDGRSVAVVDLRTLAPLDLQPLLASVRSTGRLVIVHEAARTAGVGAEVAARVQEEAFYDLEAPVQRVTGYDTPYPASRLERFYLPDVDRVLDAIDRTFSYA
jgi:pyruvate dehydrogenase E1 component beta subunit